MGIDDRNAMAVLRDAINPPHTGDKLIRAFYARWFALDPSVRDLFPPDMGTQRAMFKQALDWLLGEFIARRTEAPVTFMAQLGRDHRKYGVTKAHYSSLALALHATLKDHLGDRWTVKVDHAARQTLHLIISVMNSAAEADRGPAWWDGTVAEHHRVSRDLAVVRLFLNQPMDYHPGQYVNVEIPQLPRRWRYLSPANPAQPDGGIEFHVRVVPGGMVSSAIVEETRPGDRWRISSPLGALHVNRDGGDVLMVAGSTGLAPLRAIVLDMARYGVNPRVHLFFGARYPCELYDLRTLWEVTAGCPWLSVTPVSEYNIDPAWGAEYPDVQPPRGLHVRETGPLPEVVTRYGGWGDRQILVSGGPAMISATRAALIAKGAPAQRIQHDPVSR